MARPRKTSAGLAGLPVPPQFAALAESLGEALGRGVARGINQGLAALNTVGGAVTGAVTGKRRGRPPKAVSGLVPSDRRCKVEGCPREARSKGLCSAHYQAERRKLLQKKG